MTKEQIKKYIVYLFVIVLCVSPAFALGEGQRNLVLIGFMGVSTLVLLYKPIIVKTDFPLLLMMVCMISFPLLRHPETMRWSTVLYSCMFFLFFISFTRVYTYCGFKKEDYLALLRFLLYAYFIVFILQQICVLFHLPIINVSNYNPLEPWKLNSLTAEPSHTARFLAIIMYSYLYIQEKNKGYSISLVDSFRSSRKEWIAFLWVMVTSFSGTAILMLFVVLLRYIKREHTLACVLTAVIIIAIIPHIKYSPIERAYKITTATLTLDKEAMMRADHSASLRIVPMMVIIENINLKTIDGWVGKGIDYTSTIMFRHVRGVKKGYVGGGFTLIALEYGFIPFLIIICFSLYVCYNREYRLQSCLLWLFCCFLLGINMQITWAFIFLSYLNKKIANEKNFS